MAGSPRSRRNEPALAAMVTRNAPPVSAWQSVQLHIAVRAGSASASKATKPQWHWPSIFTGLLLLPRHFRLADRVAVQNLVGVHRDRHLPELASEGEGRGIVRNRTAAIAADIKTRP